MATTKKTAKKKMGVGKEFEIGGAVTAAVLAAAAGAYFLSDKHRRAKAEAWLAKAKKDIAVRARAARKIGKKEYDLIVDQVIKRYGSLERITAKDLVSAAKSLKAEWTNIQKHAKKLAKPMKPAAKKEKSAAAKKTSRKAR